MVTAIHCLHKKQLGDLDTHRLLFTLASPISNPQLAIGTRFRHSPPIVLTPHLRSAIHCLHKSNWSQIQTLTNYCPHSASPVSNPLLAQKQLVLDLDTHRLLFPLRISDQQSIDYTRAIGTRFRHSPPIVPTPHLRSAMHCLHRSNWSKIQTLTTYCPHSTTPISNPLFAEEQLVLDLDTHILLFALHISDQQPIACIKTIGRLRHSRAIVPTPHLRSVIDSLHKSNWHQIQTLTAYCSHSTTLISNPFLAQKQLVLDLDTHRLLFPFRISDQQSIDYTRVIGTRFRHSLSIVRTPHI